MRPTILSAAVLATLALTSFGDRAEAHPFGPPPTAEVSANGRSLEITWRAQPDDIIALAMQTRAMPDQLVFDVGPDGVVRDAPPDSVEILAGSPEVTRYLESHIRATQRSRPCLSEVEDQTDLVSGARVRIDCPLPIRRVELEVTMLQDIDPNYRTLLTAEGASPSKFAFTQAAPRQSISFDGSAPLAGGALTSLMSGIDGRAGVAALAIALLAGLLHGLGPGHSKVAGAALLAGSRGTHKHAAALGALVAGMHGLSTVILASLLYAFTRFGSGLERTTGWLQLVSGLLILGVGVAMIRRYRNHRHDHPHRPIFTRRGAIAIAMSGGLVPSPTAFLTLATALFAGRFAFGLMLAAAFSLGLAATVYVAGLAGIGGRSLVSRMGERSSLAARVAHALPVVSAAAVASLGVVTVAIGAARLSSLG